MVREGSVGILYAQPGQLRVAWAAPPSRTGCGTWGYSDSRSAAWTLPDNGIPVIAHAGMGGNPHYNSADNVPPNHSARLALANSIDTRLSGESEAPQQKSFGVGESDDW